MKNFMKAMVLSGTLAITCAAQTTVTIQQPTVTTGQSPFTVAATASSPVRVLQLYVDGTKKMEVLSQNLNTSLPLSLGTHRLAVQAVDYAGKITKSVKYVTAVEAPVPTKVFSNIQEATAWYTCGNCGNSGATGKVASYSMTRGITDPAIDSASTSAHFWIGGPYPYTNAYWYIKHTAPKTNLKALVYDFYMYVPVGDEKSPQAIEFECQHRVNGYVHNFAWQADYASKQWRTFDFTKRAWVASPVPFTALTPGTWHHVVAEFHEDGNNTVHDALTIDGVRTPVNISRPAKYTGVLYPSFSNAFQLDLNSKPTAFSVYVDKMNVSYQ
jgi:hypothetical protein